MTESTILEMELQLEGVLARRTHLRAEAKRLRDLFEAVDKQLRQIRFSQAVPRLVAAIAVAKKIQYDAILPSVVWLWPTKTAPLFADSVVDHVSRNRIVIRPRSKAAPEVEFTHEGFRCCGNFVGSPIDIRRTFPAGVIQTPVAGESDG
jgi:hypothetical protein